MTDGVWWFFLFWAPAYFSDQYGYTSDSAMGILLILTLYAIVTVVSIGGGYLPTYFVEKKGMNPYLGRMRAMLIFACFPVLGLFAQPLGAYSAWWPAILIGLLGCWTPGMECQPLLDHRRHVPEVDHRHHRWSGYYGWRYWFHEYQPWLW